MIRLNGGEGTGGTNATDQAGGNAAKQIAAEDEAVAEAIGVKLIERSSENLVEAAFDGDLDEMVSWVDKGYSISSADARHHTALSEAACQGHDHVVTWLLSKGADPNVCNDNGRSALFRSAFNGHCEYKRTCTNTHECTRVLTHTHIGTHTRAHTHAYSVYCQGTLICWGGPNASPKGW